MHSILDYGMTCAPTGTDNFADLGAAHQSANQRRHFNFQQAVCILDACNNGHAPSLGPIGPL